MNDAQPARSARVAAVMAAVACACLAGCRHPAVHAEAGEAGQAEGGTAAVDDAAAESGNDSGAVAEAGEAEVKDMADEMEDERLEMVEQQIAARGVKDARVLEAMRKVPRHLFVPEGMQDAAYEDHPLPIGWGQTISQPYIVAVMSEALELEGEEKVLEVGTGSGYQAAVLALLAKEVHSIEIVPELAERSGKLLAKLGYENVTVHAGDGYAGIPDEAPWDAVIVTAAPPVIPEPLEAQLAIGGRLVLPLGTGYQNLVRIRRTSETEWKTEEILPAVIFVPMTGKVQGKN